MNQPVIPPGFQPPAPPPMQQPQAAAPAPTVSIPPPQPQVPVEQQLVEQVTQKCTYNGHPMSTEAQQQWAVQAVTEHFGGADKALAFIATSNTVELATLAQQAQPGASAAPTPPANPISDDTTPEQPEPEKPAEPEKPDAAEFVCAECQQEAKSLRGLKTHVKKTHKAEWEDYCEKYGLHSKTGKPASGGEQTSSLAAPPATEPPASPVPTQTTPTGQVQAAPPPTPNDSAPSAASAQQGLVIPSESYLGEAQANEVYTPHIDQMIPETCVMHTGETIGAEQAPQVRQHLEQEMLTKCSGTQEHTKGFQVYAFLNEAKTNGQRYVVPQLQPVQQTLQQQLALAPNGVPTFQPAGPAPAPQAAAPASTTSGPAPAAPSMQTPIPADQHPDPMVRQAASIVGATMSPQPTPPEPVQSAPPQAVPQAPDDKRAEFARALGGEVDCVIVSLQKVTNEVTKERVDANQLAGLAQMQALQQITDPEALKYRKDRQLAVSIFSQMLTQNPKVYVLMSGYEWVLPDHMLHALMQRVTAGALITNHDSNQFQF